MTREAILEKLVTFSGSVRELAAELSTLEWDYVGAPTILSSRHLKNSLQRYLTCEISEKELEEWANLIECREDLEYDDAQNGDVEHAIYELANPELAGEITRAKIKKTLKTLA